MENWKYVALSLFLPLLLDLLGRIERVVSKSRRTQHEENTALVVAELSTNEQARHCLRYECNRLLMLAVTFYVITLMFMQFSTIENPFLNAFAGPITGLGGVCGGFVLHRSRKLNRLVSLADHQACISPELSQHLDKILDIY